MNTDPFGNLLPDDTHGVVFRRWLARKANDFWWTAKGWWFEGLVAAIIVSLIGGGIYAITRPPAVAITLDRAHWACTQSQTQLLYITQQGIPINGTKCTQWNYQP